MSKVSIIVPVYNTIKFLPQCIGSLRKQTLEDIEIIAVDDGSDDGSYELLQEYARKDKRIQVMKNARKGVGAARNTGFECSTGEYIGFVDSDDYVECTMYEKLYNKAIENNVDISIGNVSLYFMDSGAEEAFRPDDLYEKYAAYQFFNAKRFPEIIHNIGIWDRIYKRDFLIKYQILNIEDIHFEDHMYTIQTLVLADRICVVNEPFYKYRKNAGTSLTDNEQKNDNYKLEILEEKRRSSEFLKQELIYPIFREDIIFRLYWEMLYHAKYAVAFSTFKKIFKGLKEMTDDDDYQYLDTVGYSNINIFASYIKRNQLFKCYLWCKMQKK